MHGASSNFSGIHPGLVLEVPRESEGDWVLCNYCLSCQYTCRTHCSDLQLLCVPMPPVKTPVHASGFFGIFYNVPENILGSELIQICMQLRLLRHDCLAMRSTHTHTHPLFCAKRELSGKSRLLPHQGSEEGFCPTHVLTKADAANYASTRRCSRPHAPSHIWDVRVISSYTWRPIVQHAWPGWAAPAASSQCILRRGWPRCGWPLGKTRLRYSQSRCSMFCAASRHIFCM